MTDQASDAYARREKWRMFLISFAFTFLVIGVMAVITIFWLSPPAPSVTQPPLGDGAYLPTTEDDLTLLVVGEDVDTGMLTFVVAGFYPTRGNIPLAVLPRETLMVGKNKSDTLEGIYRTGGAAYVKAALEACFDISIDRWASIPATGFIKVTDSMGSTDFSLSEDVLSANGTVELSAGMQKLDGRKAVDLIGHTAYPGGETQRCEVAAQVLCSIINTHLPLAESPAADPIFNAAVSAANTDVTQVDYQQRKPAAAFMARLEISPSQPLNIVGSYNAAGNTFSPDADSKTALQGAFP